MPPPLPPLLEVLATSTTNLSVALLPAAMLVLLAYCCFGSGPSVAWEYLQMLETRDLTPLAKEAREIKKVGYKKLDEEKGGGVDAPASRAPRAVVELYVAPPPARAPPPQSAPAAEKPKRIPPKPKPPPQPKPAPPPKAATPRQDEFLPRFLAKPPSTATPTAKPPAASATKRSGQQEQVSTRQVESPFLQSSTLPPTTPSRSSRAIVVVADAKDRGTPRVEWPTWLPPAAPLPPPRSMKKQVMYDFYGDRVKVNMTPPKRASDRDTVDV